MNREEFINELNERLGSNPDKNDIISYYSELISDKMDSGYSESEAIDSLGSIDLIIENIKENNDDISINTDAFKEKNKDIYEDTKTNETKEEATKVNNTKRELSGGNKFVYVLFNIATILFCIAAVFVYILTIIFIGVGGSLIGLGIKEFFEVKSFGMLAIGAGLFILGAALAAIYYANILRKFVFKNRSGWLQNVRNSLVGE